MAIDKITTPAIADGAVSADTLTPTVITGQTAETSIATDDLILLSDTSASGALKKITQANFVSGVGETNTPLFRAYAGSNWNSANGATSTIPFDSESFDPQSKFNTSTYKFTPGVAGKYFFYANIKMSSSGDQSLFEMYLKKNTDTVASLTERGSGNGSLSLQVSTTIDSDDNDEFYIQMYQASGGSITNYGGHNISYFTGFKISS